MTAQYRTIRAGLVTAVPALPTWSGFTAFDGPITAGQEPPRFVTIGFTSEGQSGNYRTVQDNDGYSIDETGTIHAEIKAGTGSVDIPRVRTLIEDALDALDNWVRADRRLGGLLSPEGTSSLNVALMPVLQNGSAYIARWSLDYSTVTL